MLHMVPWKYVPLKFNWTSKRVRPRIILVGELIWRLGASMVIENYDKGKREADRGENPNVCASL